MTGLAAGALLGVAIALVSALPNATGWVAGWLVAGAFVCLAAASLLFAHHCDTRERRNP